MGTDLPVENDTDYGRVRLENVLLLSNIFRKSTWAYPAISATRSKRIGEQRNIAVTHITAKSRVAG